MLNHSEKEIDFPKQFKALKPVLSQIDHIVKTSEIAPKSRKTFLSTMFRRTLESLF